MQGFSLDGTFVSNSPLFCRHIGLILLKQACLSVKKEESFYKLANPLKIDFITSHLMRIKKQSLVKRWKKEYYRTVDGIMRSHAIHKLLVRLLYFACLVATIILGCLVYLNS